MQETNRDQGNVAGGDRAGGSASGSGSTLAEELDKVKKDIGELEEEWKEVKKLPVGHAERTALLNNLEQLRKDKNRLQEAIQATAPASLQDQDKQVAGALFAPISAPQQLDAGQLTDMLRTSPEARVVSPFPSIVQDYPQLFTLDPTRSTQVLYNKLQEVLEADIPQAADGKDPSEAAWYSYWDHYSDPLLKAAQLAGINIQSNRNVQDSSITVVGKRRDKLWYAGGLVLLSAEDKRGKGSVATKELADKHRGASRALYGQLGYTLHYSTGGSIIQFFAAPVDTPHAVTQISEAYNTATPDGRYSAALGFINIIRWVNTVLSNRWLPDVALPAPLFQPFDRPAGYGYSHVCMSIHGHHVEKSMVMEVPRLVELLPLYQRLNAAVTSDNPLHLAVRPTIIHVGGARMEGNAWQMMFNGLAALQGLNLVAPSSYNVDLYLQPVGCVRSSYRVEQLRDITETLLTLLPALHALGYCHRDIRVPNIIEVSRGVFRLGDFELAGLVGRLITWENDSLPSEVQGPNRVPYQPQHDIWQVGQLIKSQIRPGSQEAAAVAALSFADRLQDGTLTSHTALQAFQAQKDLWR